MTKTTKNRFDSILKFTSVFLKVALIILLVAFSLLGIGLIVSLFVPIDLFEVDLGVLDAINIEIYNVLYAIDNTIFDRIINVKWIVISALFTGLINISFLFIVLDRVRKVLQDTMTSTPFSDSNVKRIKVIGISYLIASVVLPLFSNIVMWQLIHQLDLFDASINFSIQFSSVFMGIIILILASIFEYGTHLQEDHDLTV